MKTKCIEKVTSEDQMGIGVSFCCRVGQVLKKDLLNHPPPPQKKSMMSLIAKKGNK